LIIIFATISFLIIADADVLFFFFSSDFLFICFFDFHFILPPPDVYCQLIISFSPLFSPCHVDY